MPRNNKIYEIKEGKQSLSDFFQTAAPDLLTWYPELEKKLPPIIEKDQQTHRAIELLNKRIYVLFQIYVARQLANQYLRSPDAARIMQIYTIGHSPAHVNKLSNDDKLIYKQMQNGVFTLIRAVMGETGQYAQKTHEKIKDDLVQQGQIDSYGYPGMSPLFYHNILNNTDPNTPLREKMYTLYQYNNSNFFLMHFNDMNFMQEANDILFALGAGWSLDIDFITRSIGTSTLSDENHGIFERTCFCKFNRELKVRKHRDNPQKTHLTIRDASKREQMSYGTLGEPTFLWNQITAGNKFTFNPDSAPHPYADFIKNTSPEILFVSGASGTTDSILTMAICVGMGDTSSLMDVRSALMATMITPRDHSAFEIGFSSKGLELPFEISSEEAMITSLFSNNAQIMEQLTLQRPQLKMD